MKKAMLMLSTLLAMTLLVLLQFSCKEKADPTKPDLGNYWDDNPVFYVYHDTWTPTAGVPVNTNTPVMTPTVTSTRTPCSTKTKLGSDVAATPTVIPQDILLATRYNLASSQRVWEMGVHVPSAPAGTERVRMGIYTESGADWPLSLVVETGEQTLNLGTNTFPITPTLLAAGNYWIAILTNAPVPAQFNNSGSAVYRAGEATTYGSMPLTYPALATTSFETWRMWAGYCTP